MGSFRAAVPLLLVLVVGGAAVGAVAAATIDEPARRTPLEFIDRPNSPSAPPGNKWLPHRSSSIGVSSIHLVDTEDSRDRE